MDKKLEILSTPFKDLVCLQPNHFEDTRGRFSRVFCENELQGHLKNKNIKQINHSVTYQKGSVRGFHFQYKPFTEVKIVKCIKGRVLDVVIDIRKNSKTFLQHFTYELTAKNGNMLYIPEGFAHGFQTLEDNTELLYLHTELYSPGNEGALNVLDPILNISWPLAIAEVSERDKSHAFLDENFKGI